MVVVTYYDQYSGFYSYLTACEAQIYINVYNYVALKDFKGNLWRKNDLKRGLYRIYNYICIA
ncbi:hypothetical protein GCM10011500_30070 [Mucilaginibacter rubeus]|nr:hypothetical protein GCM10011500_30070 [Mucilaginibacter rubeus]